MLFRSEQSVLLKKLLNDEITVRDLEDYQLELMNQETDYLSRGAFSSPDPYDAYDTAEYQVMKAIEQELDRRKEYGSSIHTRSPEDYEW